MLSELYNSLASYFNKLFKGNMNIRVLMIGLDGSGKTTILYKLKLDEIVETKPTTSFNIETILIGKLNMTFWDVGGSNKFRGLNRHYYANTNLVLFVIDSSDRDKERINIIKDEINNICIQDELKDAHLLIFANKQDLPNVMSTDEIIDSFQLNLITNKKWYIQPTTILNQASFYEGFNWIENLLKNK